MELVVSCRALNCTLPFLSSLYCPAWLLVLLHQAEEAAGEHKDDGDLSSGSEDEDEDEDDEDEEEEEEGDPAAAAADALASMRARLEAAAAAGRHRKQQPKQQQQQQQQRTARRKRVVAPALMPEQPGGQRVSSRQQVPNRKFMD